MSDEELKCTKCRSGAITGLQCQECDGHGETEGLLACKYCEGTGESAIEFICRACGFEF